MPIRDTPQSSLQQILEIVFKQATESISLSKTDYILAEFSFAYAGSLARVLQSYKTIFPEFSLP